MLYISKYVNDLMYLYKMLHPQINCAVCFYIIYLKEQVKVLVYY